MPWPPNSVELNFLEQIWVFIERKVRDQEHSCRNIPILRYHFLDIRYNLSPVIYQALTALMTRRIAAVLQAESSATCY
ncbi:hypothetical protein TNCV_1498691 [Trichonephila clavipes]|nr:hypothetical protein TNCV_1498691 [Trichonephila clavipes]